MVILLPQGRSFTWLGEQKVVYSNWKEGEPNQMAGCGHMTTSGQWTMTPCDAKLDAAICEIDSTPIKYAVIIFVTVKRMCPILFSH